MRHPLLCRMKNNDVMQIKIIRAKDAIASQKPRTVRCPYSLDFEVTPHLLRHTYITNLIHASVDPKTVQYLAGHENSKITMDIYAKAKYNRPDELAGILEDTFTLWDAE